MTIHKLATIVLLVLIPARGYETAAQNNQWLYYEPAIVELEGNLLVERKYGPPNFGENPRTDTKVRIIVLTLAKPVNVHGSPEDSFNVEVRRVKRIQLLVFNLKGPYQQFIGKKVVVEGSLFHAHTGGHYTDVVMNVRSITQLSQSRHSRRSRKS